MEDLNVFRKYVKAIKDVNDEIKTILYFIKDELQNSIEIDIFHIKKNEKPFRLNKYGQKDVEYESYGKIYYRKEKHQLMSYI